MLLIILFTLTLSNSITFGRDKSILHSKTTIFLLVVPTFITYYNLSVLFLASGIRIFGGFFSTTTSSFHIFILLITSVILLLFSFYTRKALLKKYNNSFRILFTTFIYYINLLLKKIKEKFRIIEYYLIILFIVTGSVFLISTFGLIISILINCLFIIHILSLIEYFNFVESPSPHSFHSPCYVSGFSRDKGKGKAKEEYKENTNKQDTKTYDSDDEDPDFICDIEKAKRKSLGLEERFKIGESSATGAKIGESSATAEKSYGYSVSSDLNHLKILKAEAREKAKEYNILKQEFMEGGATESFQEEILKPFKQKYFDVNKEMDFIKKRLYNKGINAESETDNYTEEENYSDDQYSSSSEENKPVKRVKFSDDRYSSSEENKPTKRVKFSDDNNKTLFIVPITIDFLYLLSPLVNMFFFVTFGFVLYLIELDIIPNLSFPFINLTQLISLYLTINLLILIYKSYHTAVKLYNAYYKKDYFIIYSNIYFTSILLVFYFSSHFDISTILLLN